MSSMRVLHLLREAAADPQQRLLITAGSARRRGRPAHHLRYANLGIRRSLPTTCSRWRAGYDLLTSTRTSQPELGDAAGFAYIPGMTAGRLMACSSSLVAVHLACQSLRGRETIWCWWCGTNLLFDPSLARDGDAVTGVRPSMSADSMRGEVPRWCPSGYEAAHEKRTRLASSWLVSGITANTQP